MNSLQKATTELLWSLWSEMGLPGGGRHHSKMLIDPEPLIVFTPRLASTERRLLGLVFDWCVAHASIISKPRIGAISRKAPQDVQRAFRQFSGALVQHGIHWSPVEHAGPFTRERQTMALPIERPSLLRIRMRSFIGVSARAEVLTELLATRNTSLSATDMTVAGTTRRNTDRIIAELVQGNFLTVYGKQRGRTFALANRQGLLSLLGISDNSSVCRPFRWHTLLHIITEMDALMGLKDLPASVRQIEAVKLRERIAPLLKSLHHNAPPVVVGNTEAFHLLSNWCTELASEWASGNMRPTNRKTQ